MWKLIRIDFTSAVELETNAFRIVRHLEDEYGLKELYFAHYNEGMGPYIQISVESSALDYERVGNVVKQYPFVSKWTVDDRDPDPLCHAYALAYSMCKELLNLDKSNKIEKLYELFHWSQNMLSFSDNEEAENFFNWSQLTRNKK
jgi:hypothetical protein